MKRLVMLFSLVLAMAAAMQINSAYAARKVIDNVFYINQVEDMDKSKFLGHNSCGPTSAVMLARFHNVQQIPDSQYSGWYVWNSYDAIPDRFGNYYNARWAKDWDGGSQHPHSVYGAHGYIVIPNGDDWLASPAKLKTYLENHGLSVEQKIIGEDGTADEIYEIIKQNIDAGLPLICSWVVDPNGGHYMVVIGYDTGTNGNEQKLILHDPYGDRCKIWNGTTNGDEVTYNYPTILSGTDFYRFFTIHPIGIYHWLPGWRASIFTQSSQPFVDCYNKDRNGISGKDVFGIPWNNSPEGLWVRANGRTDQAVTILCICRILLTGIITGIGGN